MDSLTNICYDMHRARLSAARACRISAPLLPACSQLTVSHAWRSCDATQLDESIDTEARPRPCDSVTDGRPLPEQVQQHSLRANIGSAARRPALGPDPAATSRRRCDRSVSQGSRRRTICLPRG